MPKTKEQFEQIKRERVEKIDRSALFLFATKGYDTITVDDIAKDSDCSHGLIFHYFGSKEGLFKHVVSDVASKNISEIISAVNFKQKPKFVLMDLLDAYLNALKSTNNEYAYTIYLLLTMHMRNNPLPKAVKDPCDTTNIFSHFRYVIEKGQEDGSFYDYNSVELTIACVSTIRGLSVARINLGSKKFRPPKSEVIAKMIIKSQEVGQCEKK